MQRGSDISYLDHELELPPIRNRWFSGELSPQQQAELPRLRQRWRQIGLATSELDPIHPISAQRAVADLYRAAGVGAPKAVLVLASPMACLVARGMVRSGRLGFGASQQSNIALSFPKKLRGRLGCLFWDRSRMQLTAQLRDARLCGLSASSAKACADQLKELSALRHRLHAMRPQFWLRRRLEGLLNAELGVELRDHILAELLHQLADGGMWDEDRASVPKTELDKAYRTRKLWEQTLFFGGQEASWLSLYDFCEHIGVRFEEGMKMQLEAYKNYVLTCGWMYAFQSVAFVSDRPAEIHFDEQQRLHNANGKAVRFCDGWGVYAWHGLRVPHRLIEDRDRLTPDAIESLANAELRRAALEIYGFDRYLTARGAKVIAADELHGQPRRLLELQIRGEPIRIVEVTNGSLEPNGTRRKFHLSAMPGDTPAEVIAASYGIAPAYYREAVRT